MRREHTSPLTNAPMLVTLTGASGSGKSTVTKALKQHHGFKEIVSFTTRPPRNGEVNGRDYHFIKREQAEALIRADETMEHVEQGGHLYGLTRAEFDAGIASGLAAVIVNPDGLPHVIEAAKAAGAAVLSVGLDAPLSALIPRLVRRAIHDGEAAAERHAARIERVVEIEQGWIDEAIRMPQVESFLVLDSSGDETPRELAAQIARHARLMREALNYNEEVAA